MKSETPRLERSDELDAMEDTGRFARGFVFALSICAAIWLIAAGAVSAIWLV